MSRSSKVGLHFPKGKLLISPLEGCHPRPHLLTTSSSQGITPLMHAACRGHVDAIRLLLFIEFEAMVWAEHRLLGFSVCHFDRGSVSVSYSRVTIAEGISPEFCQWTGRVTEFQTALKGSNIVLPDAEDVLEGKQKRGEMALEVDIKLPLWFADMIARCRVIRACSKLKALRCAVETTTSFQQRAQREVLSCLIIPTHCH